MCRDSISLVFLSSYYYELCSEKARHDPALMESTQVSSILLHYLYMLLVIFLFLCPPMGSMLHLGEVMYIARGETSKENTNPSADL